MKTLLGTINIFFGFLAGALGGMLMMLLAHPIVEIFQPDNPLIKPESGSDVIAVANTYIVFTTFIFVVITIVITGAGLWFTKWFGLSKEKEIRENMRDFFESLNEDSKLCDRFVRELFEHKQISDLLHKLVQVRVKSELSNIGADEDEKIDFSQISDQLVNDDEQADEH